MAQILKDTLGLCQMLTRDEERAARKHGLPVMRGVLYKVNEDSNGNPIFDKLEKINENTVVIGGAVLALEKLFAKNASYLPGTLNEYDGINVEQDAQVNSRDTHVCCFGVGTGGAGETIGDVHDPDFKQRFLESMIPFRISDSDTLSDSIDPNIAKKYYYRKQLDNAPEPVWGWFLKEFENGIPVPKSYWRDAPDPNSLGTEVSKNMEPYTVINDNHTLIESFCECVIKIEEDDIRPYFQHRGALPTARYNTIGLFTGKKVVNIVPGYTDYVGVRLFSVVNFNNVALDMPTSATYLYRVYAAV